MSTKTKIIIAVVILVIIGIVGFLIYKNKNKQTKVAANKPVINFIEWGYGGGTYQIPESEFTNPNSILNEKNLTSGKYSEQNILDYLKKFPQLN